jgi:hypothetical protein
MTAFDPSRSEGAGKADPESGHSQTITEGGIAPKPDAAGFLSLPINRPGLFVRIDPRNVGYGSISGRLPV